MSFPAVKVAELGGHNDALPPKSRTASGQTAARTEAQVWAISAPRESRKRREAQHGKADSQSKMLILIMKRGA